MDEQIIADVEQWLDEVVIGLDLCPFAARPRREKRVRIAVSHATDDEALLNDLQAELERLSDTPAADSRACTSAVWSVPAMPTAPAPTASPTAMSAAPAMAQARRRSSPPANTTAPGARSMAPTRSPADRSRVESRPQSVCRRMEVCIGGPQSIMRLTSWRTGPEPSTRIGLRPSGR